MIRTEEEVQALVSSEENLKAYVVEQLTAVCGQDWKISEEGELKWDIEKSNPEKDEWPNQDYELMYSRDQGYFIITCENNDAGAFTIARGVLNAKIIHRDMLVMFELSRLFERILKKARPNEWGYT